MGQEPQPPGFYFHPTDEDLVGYYLERKVHGRSLVGIFTETDPYKYDPWDLPEKPCLKGRGSRLYFFSPINDKSFKILRATDSGCWKTLVGEKTICAPSGARAVKKTKIFYRKRAEHKEETSWQMHEYMLEHDDSKPYENSYVLCKVFQKIIPKRDEHRGAISPREHANDGPSASGAPVEVINPSPEDSPDSDDMQTFLMSYICDPNKPEPIKENQASVFPVETKPEERTEDDIGNINIQETLTTEKNNVECCSIIPDQRHLSSHIEEGDFIELNDLSTPLELDLST